MLVFVVTLVRVAYVISVNPVGELIAELMYLRKREVRAPAVIFLTLVIIGAAQLSIPIFVTQGYLADPEKFVAILQVFEGALLAIGSVLTLRFMNAYSIRALEARIQSSTEKIASLQSQRRRVSRLQDTERSDDE